MIIDCGSDPFKEDFFIDLGASPTKRYVSKGTCMCLTKRRAQDETIYSTKMGACLNAHQMMSLQGFPRDRMKCPPAVSRREFNACIGNSMSVPVLGTFMRRLLVTLGYIDQDFPDPWQA